MTFAIPYSFIAGEKARSAEVNANFSYLMTALNNIADTTTIDLSASTNKLSSIGVKDVNSGNPVKMWTGLQEEYDAITTKDPMTVYYLTDTGSVFLGETSVGGGKGSRLIGEIIASTVPLTDASVHLLDGAEIAGDGVYADFVDYMKDLYNNTENANFFTTEADWQAAVSAKGICGKFVYNSTNNTVRLPKVTGIIEGAADDTTLGNTVNAGLPNIKGSFNIPDDRSLSPSGAFTQATKSDFNCSDTSGSGKTVSFDASRNAAVATKARGIYRDDCYTVQPQTIKVLYYIVLASSVKANSQIDISQIVTSLNNKAEVNLGNVTDAGYVKMSGASMPSTTYVNLTLGASEATYTAPANGWVQVSQAFITSNASSSSPKSMALIVATVYPDKDGICMSDSRISYNTTSKHVLNAYIPVSAGETFKVGYYGTLDTEAEENRFEFIYAVGSESEAS